MSSRSPRTIRLYVYTATFAAVTAVASIYGAGLKTRQELNAVRRWRVHLLHFVADSNAGEERDAASHAR